MHLGSGMIRLWDDSLPLARIASAVKDCGWIDLDNVPLMVANTLISSWDRLFAGTSKLAVENLCHSAKDIGLWGIFFMSDQLKYEICCLTCRTRMLLCMMVTDSEVDHDKNLLITNMLQQLGARRQSARTLVA
ncbi:mitochondrial-processing peptidase subunit beta [Culex quinquefasciatus]|uniref:Mitochondrial-processing peptidase subunit beta n=1 Tax=Culex quinquefasciatus TaxID=7176 RepID=B0X2A6_CULQU|nr:mitochondrial-processing peptidase subunit beta [Culex quinquefasciatus]|eukprot:XP_001863778.1 mitochondrial-processing peptidase subunit beta [Culex quinquefasciatus]